VRGSLAGLAVIVLSVVAGFAIGAAQPRPVATERIADVTVQVLVEGGKLLVGTNDIVLELRPSAGPPDVSDVILTAARSGAQDESIRADLSPGGAGRFLGTLMLPWTDSNCRLKVAWHDQHGYHRHDFVVSVVAGHH
jgi:hypothetical protein